MSILQHQPRGRKCEPQVLSRSLPRSATLPLDVTILQNQATLELLEWLKNKKELKAIKGGKKLWSVQNLDQDRHSELRWAWRPHECLDAQRRENFPASGPSKFSSCQACRPRRERRRSSRRRTASFTIRGLGASSALASLLTCCKMADRIDSCPEDCQSAGASQEARQRLPCCACHDLTASKRPSAMCRHLHQLHRQAVRLLLSPARYPLPPPLLFPSHRPALPLTITSSIDKSGRAVHP
eukprot:696346-Hanusia_phi.AAC.1